MLQRVKSLMGNKKLRERLECFQQKEEKEKENKCECAHSIIENALKINIHNTNAFNDYNMILGDSVLHDLEVLQSYDHSQEATFIDKWMKKTCLSASSFYCRKILQEPLKASDLLEKRQSVLKSIGEKCAHPFLDILKKHESDVAWFLDGSKYEMRDLYDMAFLNMWCCKFLNKNESFLTGYNIYRIVLSPLIGIFTPIAYVIIPYIIMRLKFNIYISFAQYVKIFLQGLFSSEMRHILGPLDKVRKFSLILTIVFYFQGLFNSIELSSTVYKMVQTLYKRTHGFMLFIQNAYRLNNCLWDENILSCFPFLNDFETSLPHSSYFQDYNPAIQPSEEASFSIFSHFGKQLAIYRDLDIGFYVPLIKRVYLLDSLYAISQFVKIENYCFANFKRDARDHIPRVKGTGLFHPCLQGSIVKNDICLGFQDDKPYNMLITGPNAGGKSTFVKTLLYTVLLSQTLTITNASTFDFTPFTFVNTQINIPDTKGKKSLFEAEMFRAKSNFDVLKNLPSHALSLIAMDEIFSSTNPVEGISGAYAIAKKLGEYKNAINVITTHYIHLSQLEKEQGTFSNFCMNVNLDSQGNVQGYPYLLKRGVSRQYIALELLAENGFDKDIIDEALHVKHKMFQSNK